MTLFDLIVLTANSALNLQNSDGSMPPGYNGPYHHNYTPLRNTAHWSITFLKAYEITGETKFMEAAHRCCQCLTRADARPFGKNFLICKDTGRETNGLLGPAWVIEALNIASKKLKITKYKNIAREMFLLHPFNIENSIWQMVGVDGEVRELVEIYDPVHKITMKVPETFNHVLWFAMSGLLLSENNDSEIESQLDSFFNKLMYYFEAYEDGLISHNPYIKGRKHQTDLTVRHKEIGYHAFNLYAYALIREIKPNLPFFETHEFNNALQFIMQPEYLIGLLDTDHEQKDKYTPPNLKKLGHNRYGFAYNVTGFEIAFILWIFHDVFKENTSFDLNSEIEKWTSEQINRCFNFETGLMTLNTEDEMTLAARIYEVTRLPDFELIKLGVKNENLPLGLYEC